ncbi:glycoside hydrolase family 16 protein [Parabacteroides sp. BX2]|jgi:hypothetical protein|uniref:Glycoside hydrolase family 16 protein n=1 Tax=Parabacteroides segnis TaxID=2763058 RepID=A0ABR7E0N9_9BACT|nr:MULTISPECIES: glycoside hydrolase family 16 protein [Parabacteroides]MBC5642733.1 glycoside hydrolase family 16 protein [Parabacteroides segnis]MCM0716439.1 glycoside hydrolase family 16 protein [Parabacteroides sp. TA-V-105]
MKNMLLIGGCIFLCWGCEGNKPNQQGQQDMDGGTVSASPIAGMKLVWNDEFDVPALDTNKWFTQYYSTADFLEKTNWEEFQTGTLPEPAIRFTGNSLILYTDNQNPAKAYWQSGGRKISSIQTYDWRSNKNLLGDKVGGYIEARIRRDATEDAQMVNTAFWFDSPGPDLKYYLQEGDIVNGVEGIRPAGQIYEIDMCEYLNTEIVLHGNVDSKGVWQRCIAQYLINDMDFKNKWVTHSLLWTPNSLKFYIDGVLKKEWSDPNDIKSPNHFMNIYLGAYGKDGTVSMEVDYIRFYQWDLEEGNELPNADFEYGKSIYPWEGDGNIVTENVRNGKQALAVAPGKQVSQYVYLDHTTPYSLEYWSNGNLETKVENIIPVSGQIQDTSKKDTDATSYEKNVIDFVSKEEVGINKATVKISFYNKGITTVFVDNLLLKKTL